MSARGVPAVASEQGGIAARAGQNGTLKTIRMGDGKYRGQCLDSDPCTIDQGFPAQNFGFDMRARMSVVPPGANGTTSVIGFVG